MQFDQIPTTPIPKTLSFVWIGGALGNAQQEYLTEWVKTNPDYKVILWYDPEAVLITELKRRIISRAKKEVEDEVGELSGSETLWKKIIALQNEAYESIRIRPLDMSIDQAIINWLTTRCGANRIELEKLRDTNWVSYQNFVAALQKKNLTIELSDLNNKQLINLGPLRKYYEQELLQRQNMAAASDGVRIKVLQKEGGIYLDIDLLPIKQADGNFTPLGEIRLPEEWMVMVKQGKQMMAGNHILAAHRGSPILGRVEDYFILGYAKLERDRLSGGSSLYNDYRLEGLGRNLGLITIEITGPRAVSDVLTESIQSMLRPAAGEKQAEDALRYFYHPLGQRIQSNTPEAKHSSWMIVKHANTIILQLGDSEEEYKAARFLYEKDSKDALSRRVWLQKKGDQIVYAITQAPVDPALLRQALDKYSRLILVGHGSQSTEGSRLGGMLAPELAQFLSPILRQYDQNNNSSRLRTLSLVGCTLTAKVNEGLFSADNVFAKDLLRALHGQQREVSRLSTHSGTMQVDPQGGKWSARSPRAHFFQLFCCSPEAEWERSPANKWNYRLIKEEGGKFTFNIEQAAGSSDEWDTFSIEKGGERTVWYTRSSKASPGDNSQLAQRLPPGSSGLLSSSSSHRGQLPEGGGGAPHGRLSLVH